MGSGGDAIGSASDGREVAGAYVLLEVKANDVRKYTHKPAYLPEYTSQERVLLLHSQYVWTGMMSFWGNKIAIFDKSIIFKDIGRARMPRRSF